MLLQFYVVSKLIKHVTITTTAIFKLILSRQTEDRQLPKHEKTGSGVTLLSERQQSFWGVLGGKNVFNWSLFYFWFYMIQTCFKIVFTFFWQQTIVTCWLAAMWCSLDLMFLISDSWLNEVYPTPATVARIMHLNWEENKIQLSAGLVCCDDNTAKSQSHQPFTPLSNFRKL